MFSCFVIFMWFLGWIQLKILLFVSFIQRGKERVGEKGVIGFFVFKWSIIVIQVFIRKGNICSFRNSFCFKFLFLNVQGFLKLNDFFYMYLFSNCLVQFFFIQCCLYKVKIFCEMCRSLFGILLFDLRIIRYLYVWC